jgi:hypothetical protein
MADKNDEIKSLKDELWSLKLHNKKLMAFLKAQESWEGAVLSDDGPWFDHMPEHLMQTFQEVQRLRNEAKQ